MYALIRAVSWLVCALPEGLVSALGGALGALWFDLLRYRRGVILENLARAFPELSAGQRRRLGRRAARHLVLALLETLRIPRYRARGLDSVVELRGEPILREAYARGGFIAITGHLGSFELSAGAAATRALPSRACLLVKDQAPGFDRFITELRTQAGYTIIRDRRTLPEILRALKRGEAVVFVLDQNATRDQGVFVDFFGEPACTMAAAALVAQRTGVPVLGLSIWREGPGRHVLEVHAPMDCSAPGEDPSTELTRRFTRFIEEAIRRHPEQWLWTHKRWRTRPRA